MRIFNLDFSFLNTLYIFYLLNILKLNSDFFFCPKLDFLGAFPILVGSNFILPHKSKNPRSHHWSHLKVMLVQSLENMQNLSHPLYSSYHSLSSSFLICTVSTRHTYSHTLGCVLSTAARVIFLLKILQRPHFTLKKSKSLQRSIKPCKICTTTRPCHLPSSLLLGFLFF